MKYYKESKSYARPFYGQHIYALNFKTSQVRIFYGKQKRWSKWFDLNDFDKYIKSFDAKDRFTELSRKEAFFEVL